MQDAAHCDLERFYGIEFSRHRFDFFAHREVSAIRMMENKRADARLRLHHHSLGEMNADFFRMQQLPDALLIVHVGARAVAKTITLAAIFRSESLLHRHRGRIRESPFFANPAMEPFGACLRGLSCERLRGVSFEIFASNFRFFHTLAHIFARCHHEMNDVIAASLFGVENVIAEAEAIGFRLAAEAERMNWSGSTWRI